MKDHDRICLRDGTNRSVRSERLLDLDDREDDGSQGELGYVEFLRARYDRTELWLTDALRLAGGSQWMTAKATTYLGSIESDRANYPKALAHLEEATKVSRAVGDVRREAYALSMLGRVHLLRNNLDGAAGGLQLGAWVSIRLWHAIFRRRRRAWPPRLAITYPSIRGCAFR